MKLEVDKVKLGILGGGQLGKMLLQASSKLNIECHVMAPNYHCPASKLCHTFMKGDFNNYEDVYAFGQQVDVLTIEIENVNVDALKALVKLGKQVNPSPEIIEMIQDKGAQKEYYEKEDLPTASYSSYNNANEIKKAIINKDIKLPFIQKLRTEGYDGRGVLVVNDDSKLQELFDKPSIVEKKVDIDKELAIIVARNEEGEVTTFPLVEMEFNEKANLVEFLFSPADISEKVEMKAAKIARKLANALKLQGILAIEMFLDKKGKLLINESAPRPHNSGHHTIEGNVTSQYEQHLRSILNLPLGDTDTLYPAVMVNLLGEDGHTGEARYKGLNKVLKISGAHVHLYGKNMTKPFRKMGHVTIVDKKLEKAKDKAHAVQKNLKVIS